MTRPPISFFSKNRETLLENFEELQNWTKLSGQGTLLSNATNVLTGSFSLNLITSDVTIIEKIVDFTLINNGSNIGLRFYVDDITNLSYIRLRFSNTNNFTKSFEYPMLLNEIVSSGWNFIKVPKSYLVPFGNPNMDNKIVSLTLEVKPATGKTVSVCFDSLYNNIITIPSICITFDDNLSDSEKGIEYMATKKMRGTMYINSAVVGINSNYLSIDELQELYNLGWTIGNHGHTHASFIELTPAELINNITACKNYLIDNNMPRGCLHVAYTYGDFNQSVVETLSSLGVKTARTVNGGNITTPYIYPSIHELNCYPIMATTTLATAKSIVKKCFDRGSSLFLVFHKIIDAETATGTDWLLSDFIELIDYIKSLNVRVLTVDEWDNQLSDIRYKLNPAVRRSVPIRQGAVERRNTQES